MKYERHDFYDELGGVIFSLNTTLPIVPDMTIRFTPLGDVETVYKVESVELEFSQLPQASQDGSIEFQVTSPIVNVTLSVVP